VLVTEGRKSFERDSRLHAELGGCQIAIECMYKDKKHCSKHLRVFRDSGDATAAGLLQQTRSLKFLATVFLLKDVLPIPSLHNSSSSFL